MTNGAGVQGPGFSGLRVQGSGFKVLKFQGGSRMRAETTGQRLGSRIWVFEVGASVASWGWQSIKHARGSVESWALETITLKPQTLKSKP